MKRVVLKWGIVCFLLFGMVSLGSTKPLYAAAATQVKIDKKTFPGKDFRRYVKRFDKNKNGYLSKKEIKAVKKLLFYDELFEDGYHCSKAPVENMKGMEYFTNVQELGLGFYRPKNFDTSKMKKLKTLRISDSYIKVLDLRKNKNLITLDLFQNNVTKIKFASSVKLKNLSLDEEKKLKKPDFAALKKLESLYGQSMPYQTLDLRKCKNLKDFSWCGDRLKQGALEKISFGKENTKLRSITLYKNSLTSVDWLRELPNLTGLNLRENNLTALDVSRNTRLVGLWCSGNPLQTLDVSQLARLESLYCEKMKLSALDVTKNTALQTLDCSGNNLHVLDITGNSALQELDCSKNKLSDVDFSKNRALKKLNCSENTWTVLDITGNTALQELDCSKNELSSLGLSANTALKKLKCSENNLSSLELSKNSELTELYCNKNPLTVLDVSALTKLLCLDCSNCKLTVVDTSAI